MTFGSLRLSGVYVYVTRSYHKYLVTVRKLDTRNGRILATRSTLDGEEICTKWYSEGTISHWRTYRPAIDSLSTNTAHSPSVLSPQSKAGGPA